MKPAILFTVLAFASCFMPTEPLSTSTATLGASWYDVRDEGRRLCAVVDADGCAYTRETWRDVEVPPPRSKTATLDAPWLQQPGYAQSVAAEWSKKLGIAS